MTASDSADATRIALNETTFREVNEGIEEGRREREGLVPFVCECGRAECLGPAPWALPSAEWLVPSAC